MSGSRSGQVLLIVLGALFFGASSAVTVGFLATDRSVDELKNRSQDLARDDGARERVDAVYDRWEDIHRDFFEKREKFEGRVVDLLTRHDATRQEMEKLLAEVDRENTAAWAGLVGVLTDLREAIPARDWQKIFPPPASAGGE